MFPSSPLRILGISGSLRRDSYNTALLYAAADLLPAGLTLTLANIATIPLYNDDVRQQGFPPAVARLREQVRAADALLIATPEYNYSVPGVLKNAIDWVSRPPDRPLTGKPAAIVGVATGMGGTVRAQMHLRQILTGLDMRVVNKPEVLVAWARDKFDAQGRFTDEAGRRFLAELLHNLEHQIRGQARADAAAGTD